MAFLDELTADSPYCLLALQETSGTTAADTSGNARTGTYTNSPTLNQSSIVPAGSSLKSVAFDGTNDHVSLGTGFLSSANGSSALTFELVFQLTAGALSKQLFIAWNGTSLGAALIGIGSDGVLDFRGRSTTADSLQQVLSDVTVVVGRPYHVIGIMNYTSDTMTLWVNGRKFTASVTFGATTYTYSAPNYATSIAANLGDSTYVALRASHFATYTSALSDTRCRAHYHAFAKTVTGTLTESLPVADWIVRAHRRDTGERVGEARFTGSTWTCPTNDYTGPVDVQILADIGSRWAASTAKVVGDYVFPTNLATDLYFFKCTTAGTTGGSEPTWPTVVYDTVSDGGAVWECQGPVPRHWIDGPFLPS